MSLYPLIRMRSSPSPMCMMCSAKGLRSMNKSGRWNHEKPLARKPNRDKPGKRRLKVPGRCLHKATGKQKEGKRFPLAKSAGA
ncbi:hypothetical protein DI43_11150 [Geobacillus sp. CAMR12739]|nr:hypothetical protein DI43_11150 [Geobacillus sp. CAMR12739]